MRKLREFREARLLSDDHVQKEDVNRLRLFKKFGVRPGVTLTFKWNPFARNLPEPATFAPSVRAKINEALMTWGDSFA